MKSAWIGLRRLVGRHAAFLVGVGLLFTFCRLPPLTGWDEGFYVAQLTSAVADRDLLLQNDLLRLANPLEQKLRMLTTISDDGALLNTFSIGPAVLHASYAWPLLVGSERPSTAALRAALGLGSISMLILTVLAMTALCERLGFARPVARVASVLAIAFGPLALFGTRAAVNSHLPSALLATVLCLTCWAWLDRPLPRYSVGVGLAAGLLTITRWQEVLFVFALAPAVIAALARGGVWRERAKGVALAAGAFGVVLGIQLVAWHIQFGRWLLVPQGSGYMRFTRPAILPFLLSTYHGLIPWMPGFALGLMALLWLRPPPATPGRRLFVVGLIALVAVSIYLSACPVDWWAGMSFGPRRLSSLTPLVALGAAQLLTSFQRPRVRWLLVGLLCLWSVFTLTAQLSGFDDLSVLFFGKVSRWSPLSIEAYAGARWLDAWPSWPRLLRPGFTFSDAPHNTERITGLVAILMLAGLTAHLWKRLRKSAGLQRIAVGAVGAWVVVALAWTARLPDNASWALEWREALRGTEGCSDSRTSPRGFDDARHLVCAARAERAGDEPAALHHLGQMRHAADYGVDRESLRIGIARGGLLEE
jgi:hypothetical protein